MSTELKGSPKQVSWAMRIRTERLGYWEKSDPNIFKDVESKLIDETSAAWWITVREKELKDVLGYIGQGEGSSSGEKATVKPKAVKGSPTASSLPNESFTSLDDVHRIVGELRDVATGEPVVDPECPF